MPYIMNEPKHFQEQNLFKNIFLFFFNFSFIHRAHLTEHTANI